tara:strand:- start:579 stop:1538 length:960 start_codon:yes stop_codon:yes gene_type:complete
MNKIKLLFNSFISFIIAFLCLFIFINNANGGINVNSLLFDIYIGWPYLIIASFLLIFSVYIRSLRWKYLFHYGDPPKTLDLFSAQLIGYFINNILPIRIGDIIKSYLASKKTNNKNSHVFGSIIMERVLDTLMLIFFSLIIILYNGSDYLNINFSFQSTSVYFLVIPIIMLILYFCKHLIPAKIKNIINEIWFGFNAINSSNKTIIIGFSLIIWCVYWYNVFLIQMIFQSLSLTLIDCLLILVASSFIQMIPTGFGALGLFHLGAEAVLLKIGSTNYHNFLIMLWLYSYIVYTIFGAYFFIKESSYTFKIFYNDLVKKH